MPHPVYLSPINAPLPSAESQDKYHGLLTKGERRMGAYISALFEIHSEFLGEGRGVKTELYMKLFKRKNCLL